MCYLLNVLNIWRGARVFIFLNSFRVMWPSSFRLIPGITTLENKTHLRLLDFIFSTLLTLIVLMQSLCHVAKNLLDIKTTLNNKGKSASSVLS